MAKHRRKRWFKNLRGSIWKVWAAVPDWLYEHRFVLGGILFIFLAIGTSRKTPSTDIALPQASGTTIKNDWDYFSPAWLESQDNVFLASQQDIRYFVSDPEKKIEATFAVSDFMRDRVVFWALIYGRFSRRIKVVHDRNHVGRIYGVINFEPLYRKFDDTTAERKAIQIEKNILNELTANLRALINPDTKLSPSLRHGLETLLSQWGTLEKNSIELLARSIRTQTGQRDVFLSALLRSRRLLPHIETVFRKHNLPLALARIPFVESGFNHQALSKIGAIGIWQFTPETAREMIHADEQDLWKDPLRQTHGAARLFKMYRSVLPDWASTVTSYNSGVGRVRRLLQKHKTFEKLLVAEGSDGLGFAGRNFYAELLASNIIEVYKEALFGSEILPIMPPSDSAGLAHIAGETCTVY